jgi:hypothetical protein
MKVIIKEYDKTKIKVTQQDGKLTTSSPVTLKDVVSVPVVDSLNDISDINITSPQDGEILNYNGSAWTNETLDGGTF